MAGINGGSIKFTIDVDGAKASAELQKQIDKFREMERRVEQASGKLDMLYEERKMAIDNNDVKGIQEIEEVIRNIITERNRDVQAMEQQANYINRLAEAERKEAEETENATNKQVSFKQRVKELREEVYSLEEAGEFNSKQYMESAVALAKLQDYMSDAQAIAKHLASDTMKLDEAMGGLNALAGGFSVVAGGFALVNNESEKMAELQTTLQTAMSLTMGLQQVQNALQHQSAVMLGIKRMQMIAATKAELVSAAATTKGTIATKAATVAQKAFNAVAKANPYVLLAMAIVTVVGALAAFAAGNGYAKKTQKDLNEAEAQHITNLGLMADALVRADNEQKHKLENELKIAKARNASSSEQKKIEDDIYRAQMDNINKRIGFYAEEIHSLDENREKLEKYQRMLEALKDSNQKKVHVDVELNGDVKKMKIEEAIDAIQGKIDNMGKKVEIAAQLKHEKQDAEAERKAQLEQRKRDAISIANTEKDIVRATEDMRFAMIKDEDDRDMKIATAAAKRKIEDAKQRLRTESNLTVQSRKALNEQIVLAEKELQEKIIQIKRNRSEKRVNWERDEFDVNQKTDNLSAQERRDALELQYRRLIEDAQNKRDSVTDSAEKRHWQNMMDEYAEKQKSEQKKLESELLIEEYRHQQEVAEMRLEFVQKWSARELSLRLEAIDAERKAEIENNKKLAADQQLSESDINAKYEKQRSDAILECSWAYEKLFKDAQVESKKFTKQALNDAKAILKAINGELVSLPKGITKEVVDSIAKSPEDIRKLMELIDKLQNVEDSEGGYPFAQLVMGFKKLKSAREEYAESAKWNQRQIQDADRKWQLAEENAVKDIIDGLTEVGSLLGTIGSEIESLGNYTENGRMSSIGKFMTMFTDFSSSVLEGYKNGGYGGAVASGVSSLANSMMSIMVLQAQNMYDMEQSQAAFQRSLEEISLTLKDVYDDGFGTRFFDEVYDAAKNAERALASFKEAEAGLDELAYIWADRSDFDSWITGNGSHQWDTLRDIAPEVYNGDGTLNIEVLRVLLETWKRGQTIGTELYDQLDNIVQKYDLWVKNTNQVSSVIKDTFSYLGDEALTSLTDAIINGGNAWEEFRKKGSKAIESLGEQMMYELFLAKNFQDLKSSLDAIYSNASLDKEGKANAATEAMDNFFAGVEENMGLAEEWGKEWKERAKRMGYDIWSDENSTTSLSGAVKSINAEQAGIIAGSMNAIRMHQIESEDLLRDQLASINQIKTHTAYLKTIDGRLRNIESTMRGISYQDRI